MMGQEKEGDRVQRQSTLRRRRERFCRESVVGKVKKVRSALQSRLTQLLPFSLSFSLHSLFSRHSLKPRQPNAECKQAEECRG